MKEKQQEKQTRLPRRRIIINWLWAILATIASIELGWLGVSILRSRKRREAVRASGTMIDAGATHQYEPGQVRAIPLGQFYLSCLDDGSFLALSRTCTHLGCTIPWDDERRKFICPCHGSTFDQKGEVLTAPANRPLDYFPVKIENGIIRVDISQPIRRDSFSSSQTASV